MNMSDDGFRLGHQPSLDGIRGISILMVLAFNAHLPLRGGFLGVDLFFVLSGFLITRLLLDEWAETDSLRLMRFYLRRILRLLPALVALIIACILFAALFLPQEKAQLTYRGAVFALFYVANWVQALNPPHGIGPFSPAWSLSVEEQFYLLWPLLLLVMLRNQLRRRSIIVIIIAGILASAIWRAFLWGEGAHYLRLYFGSDTRADALLMGCLTAFVIPSIQKRSRAADLSLKAAAILAFVVILYAAYFSSVQASYLYNGLYTLIAGAGALVIAVSIVSPPASLKLLFEAPPLRLIGRISYALYLWHFPVFEGLKGTSLAARPLLFNIARFGATFALAAGSYYIIERPFLRMKSRIGEYKSRNQRPSMQSSASTPSRVLSST